MKCTQRLYLTADRKKLVEEGHKKAASLYAVPGDEIPETAHDLFGLVDGHLKGFDPNPPAPEADLEPVPPPVTIAARQALYHSTVRTDTLVPEGHEEAGKLYASVGDLIPQTAHDGFGLLDGALPAPKEDQGGADKEQKTEGDKEEKGAPDKEQKSGADKASADGDKA